MCSLVFSCDVDKSQLRGCGLAVVCRGHQVDCGRGGDGRRVPGDLRYGLDPPTRPSGQIVINLAPGARRPPAETVLSAAGFDRICPLTAAGGTVILSGTSVPSISPVILRSCPSPHTARVALLWPHAAALHRPKCEERARKKYIA